MGGDPFDAVEENITLRRECGSLNTTFISIIFKRDNPTSFQDFRPIVVCNLAYKVIDKIIENKIKPILSKHMTKDQYGFFDNRKILEAIGVSQEWLHSIKTKKKKFLALKIDRIKAYGMVNQDFLGLVLLQIHLNLESTNWIMGCIQLENYVLLFNREATRFLKGS